MILRISAVKSSLRIPVFVCRFLYLFPIPVLCIYEHLQIYVNSYLCICTLSVLSVFFHLPSHITLLSIHSHDDLPTHCLLLSCLYPSGQPQSNPPSVFIHSFGQLCFPVAHSSMSVTVHKFYLLQVIHNNNVKAQSSSVGTLYL